MNGEEQFITAIIKQAIEDTAYTGISKKKIKFKMDAIDWIVGMHPEFVNYCKMLASILSSLNLKSIPFLFFSATRTVSL